MITVPDDNRLLVHICCAPCAEYPVKALREEGFDLTGFFYNPNIHPQEEWQRRLDNVHMFSEKYAFPVLEHPGFAEDFWRKQGLRTKSDHCKMCYSMRFREVAKRCAELGMPAFTTVLTVSPYQDHNRIYEIAKKSAAVYGVEFVYKDYRDFFRQGQAMAREDGLYRQKYCGCIFSLGETSYTKKIIKNFSITEEDIPTRLQA